MSALEEDAISFDYKFGSDDGFFVAAALTAYDEEEDIIEEERYGELVIEHYGWGNEEDPDYFGDEDRSIGNHYCSEQELGLKEGDSETLLYETHPTSKLDVKRYRKKFKCIEKENLVIWGNYNSQKAQ